MAGDPEVLYAIKDLNEDQKLGPKVLLGYNAGGDLLRIRKEVGGVTYERIITDPDVVDTTVDKWVEYGEWSVI